MVLQKRLLTIKETAEFLSLSPRTLYNRIHPKSRNPFPIKPKRIGKSVRFDLKDLERFITTL